MHNKSLLETKLKSIKHYQQTITDLEETLRITKDVLLENMFSLKEFSHF